MLFRSVLDGGEGSDTAVWVGLAANWEVRIVGSGTALDVALFNLKFFPQRSEFPL